MILIMLMLIGIIGCAISLALLWPYGALIALFGASFGASATVLVGSVLIAFRKPAQVFELGTEEEFNRANNLGV